MTSLSCRNATVVAKTVRSAFRLPAGMAGLAVCALLTASAVQGQAWTQPAGDTYLKLAYGSADAARQYTFDGRTTDFIDGLPGTTFRDRSLYLYAELGVTDALTLTLSLPYKRTFIRDHAFRFRTFALGSAGVGLRYRLLPLLGMRDGPNALALTVLLDVPTGYVRNYTPSAGTGQLNAFVGLAAGRSFHPVPGYAQLQLAYAHRSSLYAFSRTVDCRRGRDVSCIPDTRPDYGDEVHARLEVGGTLGDGMLLLQAFVLGVHAVRAPDIGFTALNPLPERQRALRLGGGATVYPFRPWTAHAVLRTLGLSAQYFSAVSGRNALATRELFVGIELRPLRP